MRTFLDRRPNIHIRTTGPIRRPICRCRNCVPCTARSTEADLAEVEQAEKRPYQNGGFRLYDVSKPTQPRRLHHQLTGGIGVHRFDMDERYAYISTEMDGFLGNILVVYDIRNPAAPEEVSRWWMPGQNIAAGDKPTWSGKRHRLHHALRFGNEMWASCWHGGFRVIDVEDIAPKDGRVLQLPSTVSGADAYCHSAAATHARPARRARD